MDASSAATAAPATAADVADEPLRAPRPPEMPFPTTTSRDSDVSATAQLTAAESTARISISPPSRETIRLVESDADAEKSMANDAGEE